MLSSCAPTQCNHSGSDSAHVENVQALSDNIRINTTERWLEFDATVCAIEDPDVTVPLYLEVAVCTWDTREYESLFATSAKPSTIHAGLLMLGLEPGAPGAWDTDDTNTLIPIPPTGPLVEISVLVTAPNGSGTSVPLASLIRFADEAPADVKDTPITWRFTGSQLIPNRTDPGRSIYRADIEGNIIGLSSFGGETIAPSTLHHPDLAVDPAFWIADFSTLPQTRTHVRIRIAPTEPIDPEDSGSTHTAR